MRPMAVREETGPCLVVTGAMLTHVGAVRISNEDTVAYVLPRGPDPALRRGAIMLVADGMGGHAAGEVASQIAADMIRQQYYDLEGSVQEILMGCFSAANEAIYLRSVSDSDCAGMGSTCTAIVVQDNLVYLAHVGDSRAYMVRNGAIRQLSLDHTLVAEMVRRGSLTEKEAALSPERHVILKALGTRPTVDPDVLSVGVQLHAGDRLILCSDGLSDLVDDEAIKEVGAGHEPFDACERLIDLALQAGGYDNISVGVFILVDGYAPPPRAERPTRKLEAVSLAADVP